MSTASPLTIGEALPNVPRPRIFVGTIFLVCFLMVAGFLIMRLRLSSDPLLFARVPWLLPLWILWGVYLSLALVIRSYAILFLPRTPVAIDEAIMNVGMVAIGAFVLVPVETVAVWLPVEDERIVITCTGVLAMLIAGLLVFWVWLVRKYGGPEDNPADANAG